MQVTPAMTNERTIDGAGGADRLADDDEDAGADDRAEPECGQVERADGAAQLVLLLVCVLDEPVDRLGGEEVATRCGGHAFHLRWAA
jgi:hypothetical protein